MSQGMRPIGPNINAPTSSLSFASNQMNPNMMPSQTVTSMAPATSSAQVPQIAPAQGPPHPPPSSNPVQAPSQQSGSSPHDLTKLKNLITSLRDNLRNFFLISGMNLDYHTMDNINKNLEQPPKLEHYLEDILALCNQIELCLRTILECAIQCRDSHNYLPFNVSSDYHSDTKTPDGNESKSYAFYLNVVKKQVNYAKSIYDILSESVKQIKQSNEQQPSQSQPQPQQQISQFHHMPVPSQQQPNIPNQMHQVQSVGPQGPMHQ